MRITAGGLRGRRIRHAKKNGVVRPTTARVREALFNIIGSVSGGCVLDCFAGSGIMALEALSRGAARAVSIEQQYAAIRGMEAVRREWGLEERWELHRGGVAHLLASLGDRRFTLLYADPPYRSGWEERLPRLLIDHRIRADHVVIEAASDSTIAWPTEVTVLSSRRYGESCLHFLQLQEES